VVFALALIWRWRRGDLADAHLDALGAAYANTGYVGIPLCILVFGENGLEPALIASLVVVCGIFALALVGVEVALQGEKAPGPAAELLNIRCAATRPCALVSLGLFLAHKQQEATPGVMPLVAMKLISQPPLAWYVAFELLELPALWAHSALLLAALPTGTGP